MIQRILIAALLSIGCLSRVMADPAPSPAPSAAPVTNPDSVAISNINLPSTQKPFTPSLGSIHISGVEASVVAVQAIDAFETTSCINTGYCHETNPTVRPFSRGGPLEILGAFVAADIIRHFAFRHASLGTQNLLLILQGATNVAGIMQSHNAIEQIHAAGK